ncbi:MAG: O-antigen ligase family protein [Rugosibacter sp.]|nr:O-antigen ligase family protein [Rugosibacter sp.]
MSNFPIGQKFLLSPAIPAFLFMYGVLFANATTFYTGIQWNPSVITAGVYGVALLWMIGAAVLRRPFSITQCPLDLLFGCFLAVLILSVTLQIMDGAGQKYYWRYLPLIVLPYLCGRLMRLPDVRWLFLLLVCAGIAFLPILTVEGWNNLVLYHNSGRPILFAENLAYAAHNYFTMPAALLLGSATLISALWLLARPPGNRGIRGVFHWTVLALLCLGLAYTMIRSIALATLGISAIAMIIGNWVPLRRRLVVFTALAAFISASVLLLPTNVQFYGKLGSVLSGVSGVSGDPIKRGGVPANPTSANPILGMESCTAIIKNQDSIQIRKVFLREALKLISERPLLGIGAGTFGDHSCLPAQGMPHNTVLHTFAELGLAGGLLFIGFLMASLIVLFRAIKRPDDKVQPVFLGVLMLRACTSWLIKFREIIFLPLGSTFSQASRRPYKPVTSTRPTTDTTHFETLYATLAR